ncbi:MAG: hypothetical protein FJ206_01815 [Gemmatimonadetes bacterium]|nr:hypothetical protein [Gemmatimonadota bacterium]
MTSRQLVLLVGLGTVVGCGGKDEGPDDTARATQLQLVTGDGQTGPVGSPLSVPLTVRAANSAGAGVAGVSVRFEVALGGGAVTAATATTLANGEASTIWTLGPTIGPNGQRVTATATGLTGSPVGFVATGQVGTPASVELSAGGGQAGALGVALADSIRATVKDQFGNPVGGIRMNFQPIAGGGQASPTSAVSNDQGRVATQFTLGPANAVENGNQLLIGVDGSGVSTVAFATGRFTAGTLSIESGNQQTGSPNSPLLAPLRVVARSPGGQGVQGVAVQWNVVAGGGTADAASATTDVNGRASVRWTLGPVGGAQGLNAVVPTLAGAPAAFTATALVPPAGQIVGQIADQAVPAPQTTLAAALERLNQPVRLRLGSFGPELVRLPRTSGSVGGIRALVIRFRSAAVGAAGATPASFRGGTSFAASVSRSIGQRLTTHVRAGTRLAGISPVIQSARLVVGPGVDIDSVRQAIAADPAVEWVVPDQVAWAHRASFAAPPAIPNDPLYPNQSWHYVMVDLPRAWSITTGSANVIVAVLDTGIRFDHPVFTGNLTADGYDFVATDSLTLCAGGRFDNAGDGDGFDPDPTQPSDRPSDPARNPPCWGEPDQAGGHGLHVSGTVGAAGNDGIGGTGASWRVKIRPIRVLGVGGSGSFFGISQGVLYAAGLPASDGGAGTLAPPAVPARIINMSLGGDCNPSNPSPLKDAIAAATAAGALVVVSAGNENSTTSRHCPAGYDEPLTVSAVGPLGTIASYSNTGPAVDIAAPGGDILPAQPDGTWLVHSAVCDFRQTPCIPGYARYGGTSMASPHVSGVAALLLAQTPALTVQGLRNRLLNYAVDVGAAGVDQVYGAGLLNARNSLTQTLGPPRRLFARLFNAASGATVATVPTTGQNFTFSGVAPGDYWVFGGDDEDNDGVVGAPGRRWGGFGGAHTPTTVRATAQAGGSAFFVLGTAAESEPNNTIATAGLLLPGTTVHGEIQAGDAADVYRILIPVSGTYTFETSGFGGAFCRFALELNTKITLQDAQATPLESHDDIDPQDGGSLVGNRCSRIRRQLTPGTYYLVVEASGGTNSQNPAPHTGRYRLEARIGQ